MIANARLHVSYRGIAPIAFFDIVNGRNRYQFAVVYTLSVVIIEGGDQRVAEIAARVLTHIGHNRAFIDTLVYLLKTEMQSRIDSGSVLWGIDNFQSITEQIGKSTDSGSIHIDTLVNSHIHNGGFGQ